MVSTARLQLSAFRRHRRTSEAQLFAQDSSPNRGRIVGVFSTARRKRNHMLKLIRRASTRDTAKIENHDTPSPAVQEQVSGPQRLFEPLPRFCTSGLLSHRVCWTGFVK